MHTKIMTHGSLFSGIGGFDLAAEWMGWHNAFHCEIDPFCLKILKHYWPNAQTYKDIDESNFDIWRNRIDILSGGFPCQPFSNAGTKRGTDDDRNKWPAMYRTIREILPRWVVAENVPGIINWKNGLVFEQMSIDLETAKYETASFVLPACSIDAPHERQRLFTVARLKNGNDTNANGTRFSNVQFNETFAPGRNERQSHIAIAELHQITNWKTFPNQSAICGRNDGVSAKLDGITFSAWRKQSMIALGNAVVPPLVFEIFKSIYQYELFINKYQNNDNTNIVPGTTERETNNAKTVE